MAHSGPGESDPSSDPELTVAGVAPASVLGASSPDPADPLEQAALQRVLGQLVPRDYQPVRLGRFVLLEQLGAGGMGIVHAGYDDTLDRRVALKLIAPARTSNATMRRRLFREAQAMAKLSHANVVQVFEAGEHEGHLFIAMELVEGRTLRAWLREQPRAWPEVLRMFVQIAEGLAAAHDAAVVHRDFKPDNVLIGRDERPKIADFGLATLEFANAGDSVSGGTARSGPHPSGSNPSGAAVSGPHELLTATGEVMGTPAYMAPEQYIERIGDAASDQFSFCVALYEALWGERPFVGTSLPEIMGHIVNGEIRPPPARNEVPAWVRAIVLRGLRAKPRDRFASMRGLIAALSDDPRVRRRKTAWRAAAASVVLGSAIAGVVVVRSRPQPCRDAGAPMDALWGEQPRAAITAAMQATGVAYAADTATRVGDALDRYAAQWRSGHREACEATQIRGELSAAAMDLRMACLERARRSFAATVGQLETADAEVVERAMRLVGALPRLEPCDDVEGLRARVAPPEDPTVAAEVERLRGERAAAMVLFIAGRIDAAEAELRTLQELAGALDYRPLRAEIDESLGAVLVTRSRHGTAEALLRGALAAALAEGDDAVALRAAASLVMLTGGRQTRFAEAEWLAEVGLALAQRHGGPAAEADVQNSLGALRLHQGRYDDAELAFRHALALLQGVYGEEHTEVAVAHENLGTTLSSLGRDDEALAEHRRALQIREGVFGPEHPMIALGRVHLGTALHEVGRNDEAEAELRHGLDLMVRALGSVHPDVAMGHSNLAVTLDELGRHREAQAEYRRAIAILEQTDGVDHPQVAQNYNNLGTSFEDEGRLAEAEAEYRRALAISRRAYGEDHADVARTRGNLASVHIAQGRFDDAVREADATLEISQRVLGPDHPDLLYARRGACQAHFERAKQRSASDPDGAERSAALAEQHCRAAGSQGEGLLTSVLQWREQHPPAR